MQERQNKVSNNRQKTKREVKVRRNRGKSKEINNNTIQNMMMMGLR